MINCLEELKSVVELEEAEEKWFCDKRSSELEFLVSDNIRNCLKYPSVRRQFVPLCYELGSSEESLDPLCEVENSGTERLIHRYGNRVAFLSTDVCFAYCRHCFRRRFTSRHYGHANAEQIREAADYVASHPEIEEILITGGDPLTMDNTSLERIFASFRQANPHIVIRLCSRALFSEPDRIDDGLCGLLRDYNADAALYFLTQFNCAEEFTEHTLRAVGRIKKAGVAMFNQTVLLKGVNDDAGKLEKLSSVLLRNYIKPYYVFLGDKVRGTGHLRVGVERALEIEAELRRRLSGLEMPLFCIDLPEGGGKIPLVNSYLAEKNADGSFVFRTVDGDRRVY